MKIFEDEAGDECWKEGEDIDDDEELVGVEYSCGSLVWIKFPGQSPSVLVY